MRRNVQIISFAVAFMVGIALAANFWFSFSWRMVLAGIGILVSTFLFRSKLGYVAIVAAALLLGISRYEFWLAHQITSVDALTDQKVTITGTVNGEPSWDQYHMYVFYIDGVSSNGKNYAGLVRVKTVSGQVREGQQVQIAGKAKASLGKASVLISYADAKVINQNTNVLITAKQTFLGGLNNTMSKDSAAFVAGTLVGSRSALSKNLQDLLSAAGLSHVIAVSGYNLTILVALLSRVLGKKWRWGSLIISLWVILGFVLISGANPAIVRAGIMSTIFLVASFYGRRVNLVVCMALTGMVMVAYNPANLISDIGWQLSFASLFGIATLGPKISQVLPKRPGWLNEVLSVTLAAQLATAGIIAYNFGTLSLIAPLVNCIVMPLVPIIMAYGAIVAFFGMILPSVGGIIARPLDATISILFDFLRYMNHFSWASIKVPTISVLMIAAYYGVLSLWLFLGRTTDKNVLSTDKINATITGIKHNSSKELSKVN
jgi:ComEC/Rec2-related protein